ncbi:Hypothetical protein, putative [Bodo saltans]|uniref:Uncharacterized protein n=1 Tax=Bodo saltans TaxID=75058 RepID=A0A0S4JM82_BODSA|nr:Hypothetical protein, putative [Bodo saltans]|eukprot:CUG91300.1 Hypothetical protein, putative [Bodo saltans]
MFQFGPFGGSKKPQQPVDPVQQLTTLAKTVVDDPSILNQNLREVCQHLGTPLHDKADQLLGTMVASHSSRMLSTLWTVLLQRLRESAKEPRAQLVILRHFSMIAYRISIPQRGNAFRVFAREASALCDVEALVADRSFGKSFTAVVQALGVHGEAELCLELFHKSISAVFTWTRLDARRAAATHVACLLAFSSTCGTFRQLLDSIESREDAVGKALILDAATLLAIEQGRRLQITCPSSSQPASLGPSVIAFQTSVASWTNTVVASSSLSPSETTLLPLLVSSMTKLLEAEPAWSPVNYAAMRQQSLRLLQDVNTRKVLICPLLSLLRALPPSSSAKDVDVISQHCRHNDSMTRCEAYGALERLIPILDNDAILELVSSTLLHHTAMMGERCNVSIRGILGFFAAAFPRVQRIAPQLGSKMVHSLTRSHLDLSNTVNNVPVVQQQMLTLLEHTVAYLSAGAIAYILFCLKSSDSTVRSKSVQVLLRLCDAATIDRMQLFDTVPRGLDFLENAYSATIVANVKANSVDGGGSASQHDVNRFVRNVSVILAYLSYSLANASVCSGGDKHSIFAIQTCCEAITLTTKHLRNRILSAAEWNEALVALPPSSATTEQRPIIAATPGTLCATTVGTRDKFDTLAGDRRRQVTTPVMPSVMVSMFRSLMDFVSSVVTLPIDVVTNVLEAASVCADGCSPTDCFDIYLHKSSFNLVWNILHRCCGAMDPLNVPKLHQEQSLYLSHSVLHRSLEALIHQASQSALSSADRPEESSFYKLTNVCIRLLLSLSRWGHRSPVFIAHMRHQYRFLLVCLDILASSHPICALQACHQFFVVMFFEGGGAGWDVDSDEFGVTVLSDSVPGLQRTKYVSSSVSILNRSLAFDLCHVGPSLFRLMRLFISVDVAAKDTACYRTIDETLSLFRRMSDIASDVAYYNSVVGSTVAAAVLRTLVCLHQSPHVDAIKDVLSIETLRERVAAVVKMTQEANGDCFIFGDCLSLINEGCAKLNVGSAAHPQFSLEALECIHQCRDAITMGNPLLSLVDCTTMQLTTLLQTLGALSPADRRGMSLRDQFVMQKFFAEELSYRLRNTLPQRNELHEEVTPTLPLSHDIIDELCDKYLTGMASGVSPTEALCMRYVIAVVHPHKYLPSLIYELLDESSSATQVNLDAQQSDDDLKAFIASECIVWWEHLLRRDGATFAIARDAVVPPFPAVRPEQLTVGSNAETLLDLVNWEWEQPEANCPLWRWWYNPESDNDGTASSSLLRYLVEQQIAVPEEALSATSFWMECVAEYPNIPMVFVQNDISANSRLGEDDTGALDDDALDDPTAMIENDATKPLDGDFEATAKCVRAFRSVLTDTKRGSALSTSRILAECFLELAPFPIHLGAVRDGLVPATAADVDHHESLTPEVWFCVWLENHLAPEDSNEECIPPAEDTSSGTTAESAESAMLTLMAGLPKRALAMKELAPSHVFQSSGSHDSRSVSRFFQYLGEAVWCMEGADATTNLFKSFLGALDLSSRFAASDADIPNPTLIVGFVNAFIRCQITAVDVPTEQVHVMLRVCITLLGRSNVEDEKTLSLRYSVMFLLVLIAPDRELFWQNALDATTPITNADDHGSIGEQVRRVLSQVLELPEGSDGSSMSSIAQYTVSIFLRSAALSAGIQESILWMVVKCCPVSIWNVICKEELCRSTELAAIRFLTKMSQTVGMSQHLVQEVHARYTPLLLSFGSPRSDLDSDEQRMVFWLITSLLLHTVISEERHTKPKPHMSLADALYLYVDYPLAAMSLESAVRIRQKADEFMFPFFARMPAPTSERNWNLHTRGQLLPVCGRQTLSKAAAEKVFTSILHMYTHVVSNVFESIQQMPVEALTDVFFSLSTLSAGNASLLKHSPALEGTIAATILHHVYGWYRKYCSNTLASVDSKSNVLNFRVGLFPESSSSLEFTDTFSVVSCANVISSLFVRGNELLPGAVDVSFIMEKLLCMDVVAHQSALSTVIVMSGTSTRKEMSRIAPLFTQRLFRDLDVCCKGSLSTSFGIMSLLRSAFSIVAAIPDDAVAMKVCESVWNGIVVRGMGGRRVQHYAHFLLQSMITMSSVSQTQWRTLRALIQTSEHQDGSSHRVTTSSSSTQFQNNSSITSVGSTPPPPPLPQKKSFADEMRMKLDKLLDVDEGRHNVATDHMVAIRKTSISSYATPLASQGLSVDFINGGGSFNAMPPSDQQSNTGASDVPLDQQQLQRLETATTVYDGDVGRNGGPRGASGTATNHARHFVHWTRRLLTLTTTAAAVLRSKTDEDHLDHNRVQVMALLSNTEDNLSAAGEVHLFAVQELLHEVLDPNDAMFVVLNRFNFAESSLALFNSEAIRVIERSKVGNDERMAAMAALPQMNLFFETALRRLHSAENAWWALANMILAIMSVWANPNESSGRGAVRPLLNLLGARVPLLDLVRISQFVIQKLLRAAGSAGDPTHIKDVKMFLRSLEGTTKTSKQQLASSNDTGGVQPAVEAISVISRWLQ